MKSTKVYNEYLSNKTMQIIKKQLDNCLIRIKIDSKGLAVSLKLQPETEGLPIFQSLKCPSKTHKPT